VAQAQAQVDAVMTRLARDFPDTNETKLTRVISLHDDVVGGSAVAVYVLMGAAGLVLRHGAVVAGVGIVCGLAGALGLSRFLTALTFEVSAQDPTVFIIVALLLGTIVLGASYVPARRATRVDPLTALRSE
jgi:hypothetical protein